MSKVLSSSVILGTYINIDVSKYGNIIFGPKMEF